MNDANNIARTICDTSFFVDDEDGEQGYDPFVISAMFEAVDITASTLLNEDEVTDFMSELFDAFRTLASENEGIEAALLECKMFESHDELYGLGQSDIANAIEDLKNGNYDFEIINEDSTEGEFYDDDDYDDEDVY
jgi:hypothetical protein